MTDETVYRYDRGPEIELRRRPFGEGRYLHWLHLQRGLPGVVIVPHDGDAVLLQLQFRASIDTELWQLPRGFRDLDERDPLDAARRELAEETSLVPTDLRRIGTIAVDPGIQTTRIDVVDARIASLDGARVDDPDEDVRQFAVVPLGALDEWIADGRLHDGISLAALAVWRAARRAG